METVEFPIKHSGERAHTWLNQPIGHGALGSFRPAAAHFRRRTAEKLMSAAQITNSLFPAELLAVALQLASCNASGSRSEWAWLAQGKKTTTMEYISVAAPCREHCHILYLRISSPYEHEDEHDVTYLFRLEIRLA